MHRIDSHSPPRRQAVVSAFDLFEGELAFVDRLLTEDVRNNSAWNHRMFVLRTLSQRDASAAGHMLDSEAAYAAEKVGSPSHPLGDHDLDWASSRVAAFAHTSQDGTRVVSCTSRLGGCRRAVTHLSPT